MLYVREIEEIWDFDEIGIYEYVYGICVIGFLIGIK